MDEISHFPFSIVFRNIYNSYRIWYSILRVLNMWLFNNEMEKKYYTVGTFQNSNRQTVERDTIDTPTHKYMTAWYRHFNKKRWG